MFNLYGNLLVFDSTQASLIVPYYAIENSDIFEKGLACRMCDIFKIVVVK